MHLTIVCFAGWSFLFPGTCCCRSVLLDILLPACPPAPMVLLWWWMWDHSANMETSGGGWILRPQAEAHSSTSLLLNQTTYRRLCCEIDCVWLALLQCRPTVSVLTRYAQKASPLQSLYDRLPGIWRPCYFDTNLSFLLKKKSVLMFCKDNLLMHEYKSDTTLILYIIYVCNTWCPLNLLSCIPHCSIICPINFDINKDV